MNVIIVMPAYQAEKTLEATVKNLPPVYHDILVCDDASKDGTFELSKSLGLASFQHSANGGYGANQKTLYCEALKRNADVIIMVHPDNQYKTDCLPEMIALIESGQADLVLGSRMKSARKNNMPAWKYLANRFLTAIENLVFGTALSEFHTGLRAYDAHVLREIPFETFSDDFSFDSEMIACMRYRGYPISEVDTECYYTGDVSSINFSRSVKYGLDTLWVMLKYISGYYSPK